MKSFPSSKNCARLVLFIRLHATYSFISNMSVDVFGRQLAKSGGGGGGRGPTGQGFLLTDDGNYDIASKVLCNVADAREKTDAVNLEGVERVVQRATQIIIEHFNPMIEELRRIEGEIGLSVDEALDPIAAELMKTKNTLNDLVSKFRLMTDELKLTQTKVNELESRFGVTSIISSSSSSSM